MPSNAADEVELIGHGVLPAKAVNGTAGEKQGNCQHDIDEGAGNDAPEGGAGALRRADVGYAAEGPEHDGVGSTTDGAAGEGVAELVEEDDGEEGEVFEDVPEDGAVAHVCGPEFRRAATRNHVQLR